MGHSPQDTHTELQVMNCWNDEEYQKDSNSEQSANMSEGEEKKDN